MKEGRGGEAQEASLIPISWRGANVHAIYCMTASHISINPLHEAGNRKGGAEGPRACVLLCVKERRKETGKEMRESKQRSRRKRERCKKIGF